MIDVFEILENLSFGGCFGKVEQSVYSFGQLENSVLDHLEYSRKFSFQQLDISVAIIGNFWKLNISVASQSPQNDPGNFINAMFLEKMIFCLRITCLEFLLVEFIPK